MSLNPSIVTFISGKGGSGKTVTSSAVGRFLASLGFKVLLVDTDASTNGLTMLFLTEVNATKRSSDGKLAGVFEVDNGLATSIRIAANLDFIPAAFTLSRTDTADLKLFENALISIVTTSLTHDFVLLDAQAGSDEYAKIAASLGDQVVIVSEFDPISAQGVDRLKVLFSSVMRPDNTWILYNKVLPEFTAAIVEGLVVTRVLPPIAWNIDVIRSFAQRTLAIDVEDPNDYTVNISQVAGHLLGQEVRERISNWLAAVLKNRKDPILSDLEEIDQEIDALQRTAIETEFALRRKKRLASFTAASGSLLGFIIPIVSIGILLNSRIVPANLFESFSYLLAGHGGVSGLASATAALLGGLIIAGAPAVALIFILSASSDRRTIESMEQQKLIDRRVGDLLERRQRLKVASETIDYLNISNPRARARSGHNSSAD